MSNFFEELKKRNVYKTATAYAVTSWLILQIVDVVGPGLGWDESVTTLLLKILIVGFPIALVLAWLYELTPKGFKRTGTHQGETADNKKAGRRLNYFIIGVLAIAVCFLLVDKLFFSVENDLDTRQEASMLNLPEFTSSIAVLAFDDMSPNKDQEYLSDGISEEILNYLAKYKDLKVISRTSSFAYKGKDVTIDIIGEELGVAYVLEGSVRKAGDTYRITVQLIDTQDGSHIWSDTFDRKIEDVLFVQDEIARIVAERLNLTLSNEDVRLRKVDPVAYDLYLRSVNEINKFSKTSAQAADSLIRLSLEIDPEYSKSWSTFSQTTLHSKYYYSNIANKDSVNEVISTGLKAAKKAIELDSTNIGGYVWLSNWQWHDKNGRSSLETLELALKMSPNNSGVYNYASHCFQRMGMIERALEAAQKGVQLNPNNFENFYAIASLEDYRENFEESLKAMLSYVQVYEKIGRKFKDYGNLAWLYYKTGKVDLALNTIEKDSEKYWRDLTKIMIYYSEKRVEEANKLLDEFKTTPEDEAIRLNTNLNFDLALIYALKDEHDAAFLHLEKAYPLLLTQTEWLFSMPEFKNLHEDPRWQQLLDRLGEEFNFDYNIEG